MPETDLADKSLEELAAMLDNPASIPAPEPEAAPEAPAAVPPPAEPETPAAPEPEKAPAPEVEADIAAQEAARARMDEERRELLLEKLQKHNSRLAGQIGELQKVIAAGPRPEGGYAPDAGVADERVSEIQTKLERLEQAQEAEARGRAIQNEIAALTARPDFKDIKPEHLQAASQKYESAWGEVMSETDPELARISARGVILSVGLEAKRLAVDELKAAAQERIAQQTRQLSESKLNASVAASGSSAPEPKVETPLADKSVAELRQMLDNLGR